MLSVYLVGGVPVPEVWERLKRLGLPLCLYQSDETLPSFADSIWTVEGLGVGDLCGVNFNDFAERLSTVLDAAGYSMAGVEFMGVSDDGGVLVRIAWHGKEGDCVEPSSVLDVSYLAGLGRGVAISLALEMGVYEW